MPQLIMVWLVHLKYLAPGIISARYSPQPSANDEDRRVILKGEIDLQPGDRVRLEFGGGGGFGPPTERPVELIKRDLALGYVSPSAARDVYGFEPEDREPDSK